MRHFFCGLACLLIPAVISGCGSDRADVAPASGVVNYQGQPVEGAQVTFMAPNASRAAFGVTDAQGRFTLSTFGTNDGAVAGTHTVTVAKPTPSATTESMSPDDPSSGYGAAMQQAAVRPQVKSELPAKYADPQNSGLTCEVTLSGPNEFTLDLQ